MNVLDLFSGIGGFSLGLERAGFKTVAFCEIEPYARAVLRKHWPDVPCYEDVRAVTADRLRADGIHVDVICGGFPCQDISFAGEGAGLAGSRSGLWSEYRRLVSEVRPRFVIVENVAALLSRGLGTVLGDLAEIGYDAEWEVISAAEIGAPHKRERVWIVAYPCGSGLEGHGEAGTCGRVFNEGFWQSIDVAEIRRIHAWDRPWSYIARMDDGFPARAHRLRALGNAVVPQIPEIIGRAIMAAEISNGHVMERDESLADQSLESGRIIDA